MEATGAEESKLLMKALADADWQDVNAALTSTKYPPHPYRVFLELGVKKTDGYDPPTKAPDFREVLRHTHTWIRDYQEKYRIQRYVSGK